MEIDSVEIVGHALFNYFSRRIHVSPSGNRFECTRIRSGREIERTFYQCPREYYRRQKLIYFYDKIRYNALYYERARDYMPGIFL